MVSFICQSFSSYFIDCHSKAQQILAVVVLLERLGELVDLVACDVAHAVGDLFKAGDLEALAGLDGLDEGGCLQ